MALAVSDDGNGDTGDGECGGRNYPSWLIDSMEHNVDTLSSLSSAPGVPSKERSRTVDGGSSRCFAANARSSSVRGPLPDDGLWRSQNHCEPLTPRSAKQVLSPFWIPPVQEPPSFLSGSPGTAAEGQPRTAARAQRVTSSDSDSTMSKHLEAAVSYTHLTLPTEA